MTRVTSARAMTGAVVDRFAGLSAGYRLVILLTLALLPLGLLAVISSLQISRSADAERRAVMRIAALESARRLSSELAIDAGALRAAANMLERGEEPAATCARVAGVLGTSFGKATRYVILGPGGRAVCGQPALATRLGTPYPRTNMDVTLGRDGMTVLLPGDTGAFVSAAFYPTDQLRRVVRPAGLTTPYILTLFSEGSTLSIAESFRPTPLERRETVTVDVPNTPLKLVFIGRSAPFTGAEILTMLLPMIMWLVAAGVAWLVFERLVIGPLAQLRANVATYKPGEIMQPLRRMTIPAREIEELGETFQAISQTVAAHEQELARGLSNQTKLTREVHHRVKNNLQVVSSLINLHARGSQSPEAGEAYASIGRRVDALAVVHRNHFAELEENRGVNLRSLIGELTANLRATAPGESRLSILIDVPNVHVGQDTAIPVAFLVTELVELAMTVEKNASIRVSVVRQEEPDRACLVVASTALREANELQTLLGGRYGRVLEGLSRQLRYPLERESEAGVYRVCFALVPDEAEGDKKS